MSYVGLANPYISELTNEDNKTYSNCFKAGEAIGTDVSPEYNEATLYGDNRVVEQCKEFKRATVKLNTTRLPLIAANRMYGHTVDGTEVIYKTDDNSPYCGMGFYVIEKINNVDKYVAMFIYKIKFNEGAEGFTTKGDNIEFKTPSVDGIATALKNKEWKKTKVFDTEAEADEWLQVISGYKAACTKPTASIAAGEYAETQSVTLTAGSGETIYYTTNGTTPSATNGEEYTEAISIAASCALKAIAIKTGNANSEIATFEYLIS